MKYQELPDEVALEHLHSEAASLEESIHDLGSQISRALQSHSDGTGVRSNVLSDVHELHEAKQARMFELGRASARIEEVEMRIAGRHRQRQTLSAEHDQASPPPRNEDRISWLGIADRESAAQGDAGSRPEPEPDRRAHPRGSPDRHPSRTETAMDRSAEIEALRKHGLKLKREIRRTNRDLDRALRDAAAGRVGRALRVLNSRFEHYADLMYEFDKVTAQIRDLRMQGPVHEQRGWDYERPADEWEKQAPVGEDRLAWLGLKKPARDERHDKHERDVPRSREPDDDRDWEKR